MTDHDANSRTVGCGPDAGAFEYTGGATPPPPPPPPPPPTAPAATAPTASAAATAATATASPARDLPDAADRPAAGLLHRGRDLDQPAKFGNGVFGSGGGKIAVSPGDVVVFETGTYTDTNGDGS